MAPKIKLSNCVRSRSVRVTVHVELRIGTCTVCALTRHMDLYLKPSEQECPYTNQRDSPIFPSSLFLPCAVARLQPLDIRDLNSTENLTASLPILTRTGSGSYLARMTASALPCSRWTKRP